MTLAADDLTTGLDEVLTMEKLRLENERLREALSIIVAYSKPYHDGQGSTLDRICLVAIKALANTSVSERGENNG